MQFKRIRPVFYIGLILLFSFIVGFRDSLGHDYMGYKNVFLYYFDYDKELLVNLIIKVLRSYDFSYPFFFFTYALLTFSFFFLSLQRYRTNLIIISLFLFLSQGHLYFQTYNIIRQMLSVMILFYCFDKSSKVRYLCYALAVFSHSSSIIVIPVMEYVIRGFSIKFEYLLYIFSLALFFFSDYVKLFLSNNFSVIFENLGGKYDNYLTNESYDKFSNSASIGLAFYYNIIVTSLAFYFKKVLFAKGCRVEYQMFFIGQILNNILHFDITLVRVSYYFLIYGIIVIPFIQYSFSKHIQYLYNIVTIAVSLVLFYYSSVSIDSPYVPYKNVLFSLL